MFTSLGTCRVRRFKFQGADENVSPFLIGEGRGGGGEKSMDACWLYCPPGEKVCATLYWIGCKENPRFRKDIFGIIYRAIALIHTRGIIVDSSQGGTYYAHDYGV